MHVFELRLLCSSCWPWTGELKSSHSVASASQVAKTRGLCRNVHLKFWSSFKSAVARTLKRTLACPSAAFTSCHSCPVSFSFFYLPHLKYYSIYQAHHHQKITSTAHPRLFCITTVCFFHSENKLWCNTCVHSTDILNFADCLNGFSILVWSSPWKHTVLLSHVSHW